MTSPPPKKGVQPPICGPCWLWPNGWMDQDATWYEGRSRPMETTLPLPKVVQPQFSAMSIVAKWSPISATAEHLSYVEVDFPATLSNNLYTSFSLKLADYLQIYKWGIDPPIPGPDCYDCAPTVITTSRRLTSGYATWFTSRGAIRIAHYDIIDDVITGKL